MAIFTHPLPGALGGRTTWEPVGTQETSLTVVSYYENYYFRETNSCFFSVKEQLSRLADLEAKGKRKRDSDRVYSVEYVLVLNKGFKRT